jgi:hypothetical protein
MGFAGFARTDLAAWSVAFHSRGESASRSIAALRSISVLDNNSISGGMGTAFAYIGIQVGHIVGRLPSHGLLWGNGSFLGPLGC